MNTKSKQPKVRKTKEGLKRTIIIESDKVKKNRRRKLKGKWHFETEQ